MRRNACVSSGIPAEAEKMSCYLDADDGSFFLFVPSSASKCPVTFSEKPDDGFGGYAAAEMRVFYVWHKPLRNSHYQKMNIYICKLFLKLFG